MEEEGTLFLQPWESLFIVLLFCVGINRFFKMCSASTSVVSLRAHLKIHGMNLQEERF